MSTVYTVINILRHTKICHVYPLITGQYRITEFCNIPWKRRNSCCGT